MGGLFAVGRLWLVLILLAQPAAAFHKSFNAVLDSGDYAGTSFTGTFSYDDTGATGVGTDYLGLKSLRFSLFGTTFTQADIDQGGQVILQDGAFFDFTAAIFPPTPWPSPVSDIAFGFGGQGVIGYIGPSNQIGLGHYVVEDAAVSEAPSLPLFAALVLVIFGGVRAKWQSQPSERHRRLPSS